MKYKTSYTYDNPGRGGPNRGSIVTDRKYQKGESIYAMFGIATVKASSKIKEAQS